MLGGSRGSRSSRSARRISTVGNAVWERTFQSTDSLTLLGSSVTAHPSVCDSSIAITGEQSVATGS